MLNAYHVLIWRPSRSLKAYVHEILWLNIIYQGNICLQLDVRWYSSFSKDMLPWLATAEVLNYKKLTPLASKILHRILYRIIVLIPDRDSRSIKTYKTSTSCLRNTMQNTTQNHTANPSGRQQKYYNIQNWHLLPSKYYAEYCP